LARAIGVPLHIVAAILRGELNLCLSTIAIIARFFDIDRAELFDSDLAMRRTMRHLAVLREVAEPEWRVVKFGDITDICNR
jgi:plasmid maintenance system antidote protein VapI